MRIVDPILYLPYYIRNYVLFGLVPPVLIIHIRSPSYDFIYCVNTRGRASVHSRTSSRNIRVNASVHTRTLSRNSHTISRNVCAHASASIRARASMCILARTSMCMFVLSRASAGIRSRGAFSTCLSVIMSNTNVYILKLCIRWIQVSCNCLWWLLCILVYIWGTRKVVFGYTWNEVPCEPSSIRTLVYLHFYLPT